MGRVVVVGVTGGEAGRVDVGADGGVVVIGGGEEVKSVARMSG